MRALLAARPAGPPGAAPGEGSGRPCVFVGDGGEASGAEATGGGAGWMLQRLWESAGPWEPSALWAAAGRGYVRVAGGGRDSEEEAGAGVFVTGAAGG